MAKRARRPDKRVELAAVKRRVLRATTLLALYIPAATIVSAGVIGAVLLGLNRVYGSWGQAGNIVLYPNKGIWFVMAFFVGGCLAFLSGERVSHRLFGPKPSFWIFEYERASGPLPAYLRTVLVVALLLLSVVCAANVRAHAVLTVSAIVEQHALAVGPNRYPYSQIARIAIARYFIPPGRYNGARISKDRRLFIWLRNGERWSPKDSELFAADESQIAQYIAGQSGLAIEFPKAAVDVPEPGTLRRRGIYALVLPLLLIVLTLPGWKRFVKQGQT